MPPVGCTNDILLCSIQQAAAKALGRLANYSDDLAEAIVTNEILPQLVQSLANQNRFYKKAAAFCLRAVARHSPPLAQAVVESGALDCMVTCLEDFDPGVKEEAAWALGYIAAHNAVRFHRRVANSPFAMASTSHLVHEPTLACKVPRQLQPVWQCR